jgi:hypothetical protein
MIFVPRKRFFTREITGREDAGEHPDGFGWKERFPEVFNRRAERAGGLVPPEGAEGAKGSKTEGINPSARNGDSIRKGEGGFDCSKNVVISLRKMRLVEKSSRGAR